MSVKGTSIMNTDEDGGGKEMWAEGVSEGGRKGKREGERERERDKYTLKE